MTPQNRRLNAQDEMRKGLEALAEARLLADGALWNGSVSRAYYAAFHWARALLVVREIEPKTHRGTIRQLNAEYVRDGNLDGDKAALLAHLEGFRALSDYDSSATFGGEEARRFITEAEDFIAACRALGVLPQEPGEA